MSYHLPIVIDIRDWSFRMTKKHGEGGVMDFTTNQYWDWGQALCREVYGIDWMHDTRHDEDEDAMNTHDKAHDFSHIERAMREWENGKYPDWTAPSWKDEDNG